MQDPAVVGRVEMPHEDRMIDLPRVVRLSAIEMGAVDIRGIGIAEPETGECHSRPPWRFVARVQTRFQTRPPRPA
ncbi:hypothetical protein Geu3261_0069_027 [Komagataeibacter europaeus NBRC 3261]|uniref:Uncharacterized protein n=1 Tax=Komagataeibacter europaeus NBRC 3261 TaxID=1234669 RepID=A0A0D6Q0C9_KOMEU|nr:hypothetical protein Geu3261_0069_027 [Komagataeibacter europaeus NBRC 3261]